VQHRPPPPDRVPRARELVWLRESRRREVDLRRPPGEAVVQQPVADAAAGGRGAAPRARLPLVLHGRQGLAAQAELRLRGRAVAAARPASLLRRLGRSQLVALALERLAGGLGRLGPPRPWLEPPATPRSSSSAYSSSSPPRAGFTSSGRPRPGCGRPSRRRCRSTSWRTRRVSRWS